jgi:threonine dehydratase
MGLWKLGISRQALTVMKAVRPDIEVVAVQSESAPAAYQSWKAGKIVSAENTTFAGGVATGTAYGVPFSLYSRHLDDFILLSEKELYQGMEWSLIRSYSFDSRCDWRCSAVHTTSQFVS